MSVVIVVVVGEDLKHAVRKSGLQATANSLGSSGAGLGEIEINVVPTSTGTFHNNLATVCIVCFDLLEIMRYLKLCKYSG